MSASILVTYATRYGSTVEVARVVAETIRENGMQVDVQPVLNVRSLEPYDAVVLGAPLYIGHWHKDAQRFLSRHEDSFSHRQLPLFIFALGPLHDDEAELEGAREQLTQDLAQHPSLEPLLVEVFGGKYDPDRLNFLDRIIAALPASPLHNMEASDVRNWTAIHAWANSAAHQIESAVPVS